MPRPKIAPPRKTLLGMIERHTGHVLDKHECILKWLPHTHHHPTIVEEELASYPDALRYVYPCDRTPALYMKALNRWPAAIKYVPYKDQSLEMCWIAVLYDPKLIEFTNEALWTNSSLCEYTPITEPDSSQYPTLLEFAISELGVDCVSRLTGMSDPTDPSTIKKREGFRFTPLVRNGGWDIPGSLMFDNILTEHLHLFSHGCERVVAESGLQGIPVSELTEEICQYFILRDPSAIRYVSDEFQTIDMCMLAVTIDGMQLQHVSKRLRTYDVCKAAVESNPKAIKFVNIHVCCDRMIKLANIAIITGGCEILKYITPEQQTKCMKTIGKQISNSAKPLWSALSKHHCQ